MHVSSESMIPDHCRAYALSYPQDDDYIKKCDHEHNARCDRCEILPTVFHEIQEVLGSVDCDEERDEMEYMILQNIRGETKYSSLEGSPSSVYKPGCGNSRNS